MKIPQHIHQTWKQEQVPQHLAPYVQSWKDHQPGWGYTLWTDKQNRDFIAAHYPAFLAVYDQYPTAIQQVDAARYFILRHYGGLFIDLDFECLRNTEALLQQAEFVAGREPQEHAKAHRKDYIISNAFMAAAPGSAFLASICALLQRNDHYRHAAPGFGTVLESTGPFMLSKAYEQYPHKETIRILDHDVLYPLVKENTTGRPRPEDRHSPALLQRAYAIHHYWGSWWHQA